MTPIQQLQYKKLIKQYSNAEWKYIAIDHTAECSFIRADQTVLRQTF